MSTRDLDAQCAHMTFEAWLVFGLIAAMMAAFITDRFPPEAVALVGAVALLLTGILSPAEALSGFSNPATVTVATMFVLSAGLQKTGALAALGAVLMRAARWPWLLLLLIMVVTGAMSAFVNNTAAVAVLLPLVLLAAQERKLPASRFLLPLSYAAQFGGVCTLIGTSTNLLVNSIAIQAGLPAFSMFEFTELGVILFGAGTVYLWLLGPWLLPDRPAGEMVERYGLGEFITEFRVMPGSSLIGRVLRSGRLPGAEAVVLVELVRDQQHLVVPQNEPLRAGDLLIVRGEAKDLLALRGSAGLELNPEFKLRDAVLQSGDLMLAEAIVAPGAPFAGQTIGDLRLGDAHELAVLALQRRGAALRSRLAHTPLEIGDLLLFLGSRDAVNRLTQDRDFILLGEVSAPRLTRGRVPWALGIMGAVVLVAALGLVDILPASILGGLALWATGCLKTEEVFEAVQWRVIVLLAAMIPLGVALEKSGGAAWIARHTLALVGDSSPVFALGALYLFTALLTEFMSNGATAVLIAPLAIGAARGLGVDPQPFLMAVVFGASAGFATPVGYQTNAMVYTAGGYRFTDFLRLGLPLDLLFFLIAMWGIPHFWPF
ncbi:MAG TPA: SLC13 family permease [Opitutaceae bacterium]|nr:SLC13 family permease [Opitutaceae bacterium]